MDQQNGDSLRVVRDYHRRTKHRPNRYAASLEYMDWANKPDLPLANVSDASASEKSIRHGHPSTLHIW